MSRQPSGEHRLVRVDENHPKKRGREEMRRVHMRRRAVFVAAVGVIVLGIIAGATVPGGSDGDGVSVAAEIVEPDPQAAQRRDVEAIDGVLGYARYIVKGRPGERRVALTFDDGPGPDTPRILAILDRHDVKATFFSLGEEIAKRPEVARRALSAGHVIAGHTGAHARMSTLSEHDQREQLRLQDAAFAAAGLPAPRLFRPPYGTFDPTTRSLLAERGSLMVLWSVDTADFGSPGAKTIVRRALNDAEPGAIILMHDGPGSRPQTVAALPRILRGLRARKLEPVTVPELLRTNPPPRAQPAPAPLDGPG
jgi:peptidoglycan-N-acetylglucosamine deacetylase